MHTVSAVKDRHQVEFFLLGVYTSCVHIRSMARSASQKKKKGFKGYVHTIRPDSCFDGTKAIPDGASVYT